MRGKNKIQVNLVLLWRRNTMEGKSPAPQPTLSWPVIQVFAPCIDHQMNWYAVTKESCGIIPRFFSQNIFFSRFQDEIFSVSKQEWSVMSKNGGKRPFDEWVPEKGETLQRQPGKVHIVSSFRLFVGLLRPREISERLVLSEFFAGIKSYVNGVCVDSRIGAKSNEEQTIQNLNAKIASLELELEKLKCSRSF